MTIGHAAKSTRSHNNPFRGQDRRRGGRYERELPIHKYTGLLRAGALLRENDKLGQQRAILSNLFAWSKDSTTRVASLTPPESQIMQMILDGHPSKNIAADIGIAQRTVENHRASIMKKTGSRSIPALVRFALAAAWNAPTAQ